MVQSGTALAGTTYDTQRGAFSGSSPSSSPANNQPYWYLGQGLFSSGSAKFSWFASTMQALPMGTSEIMDIVVGGTREKRSNGHYCNALIPGGLSSITGFRLFSNSFTMVAGSYLRAFVVQ
jgi:hypothetical protein